MIFIEDDVRYECLVIEGETIIARLESNSCLWYLVEIRSHLNASDLNRIADKIQELNADEIPF